MTDLEILQTARDLIADPTHWIQGTAFRGPGPVGHVLSRPDNAVKFCAAGAVCKAMDTGGHDWKGRFEHPAWKTLRAAGARLYNTDPMSINDNLGHAAVIAVFNEAIRQLQQQEVPA